VTFVKEGDRLSVTSLKLAVVTPNKNIKEFVHAMISKKSALFITLKLWP